MLFIASTALLVLIIVTLSLTVLHGPEVVYFTFLQELDALKEDFKSLFGGK